MRPGHALTALDRKGGKIVLTLAGPDGEKSESFDAVILTLPFTKLRQVEGLKSLKLTPEQLKCIRELGHGAECQDLAGHHVARVAECRFWPAGAIERHLLFRSRFSESVGRRAVSARRSRHHHRFSRGETRPYRRESALAAFRADLAKMSPKMAESLDPAAVASFFWANYPFTLGGSPAPGRTIHHHAGRRRRARSWRKGAIRRRAYGGDFIGFMNGGVQAETGPPPPLSRRSH